jgi:hypothetical protein
VKKKKQFWSAEDSFPPKWCTAQSVHDLLRNSVLKGDARLPGPTDEAVDMMARALGVLHYQAHAWAGPWLNEKENLRQVSEAISTIVRTLPLLRDEYIGEVFADSRSVFTHRLPGKARDDLAALDFLISAARQAQERQLPITAKKWWEFVPPIKGWKDLAEDIHVLFTFCFPDQPKAAAYRFIAAVAPLLTGEHPTVEAVQTALKKKRYSNRGKFFTQLLLGQTLPQNAPSDDQPKSVDDPSHSTAMRNKRGHTSDKS